MASSSLPIYTYTSARSGSSYSTNTPGGLGGVYGNSNYTLTSTKQPGEAPVMQTPATGLTYFETVAPVPPAYTSPVTTPYVNTATQNNGLGGAPEEAYSIGANNAQPTGTQPTANTLTSLGSVPVKALNPYTTMDATGLAPVMQAAAQQAAQPQLTLTAPAGTQPTANTLAALAPVTQPVTQPVTPPVTQPVTQPVVSSLTAADLATWGKTLPQGITSDQLKTALEGQQTALSSQNKDFLKDWNTSADALKTNILSGVDTKNQAFGTQATKGFMDAFKNFQIPTNQQTGVNMGNYNDNRNAAADQWWSQYVTGRR